jgi:predicted DNA-binding transcriptional regulator AlpA
MEKLLTQAEVASFIGMSESWLAWHRWYGDSIPFLKIGRSVRYRLSDVQAWVDQHQRQNSTQKGGC